jgi:hypothetical protein
MWNTNTRERDWLRTTRLRRILRDILDIKLKEVGRLRLNGHSKAVTNEDHSLFVTEKDWRDTQETWETCHSDGICDTSVTKELRQAVQELNDLFLTHKDETYRPKQTSQRGRQEWRRTNTLELYVRKRSPVSVPIDHRKTCNTTESPSVTGKTWEGIISRAKTWLWMRIKSHLTLMKVTWVRKMLLIMRNLRIKLRLRDEQNVAVGSLPSGFANPNNRINRSRTTRGTRKACTGTRKEWCSGSHKRSCIAKDETKFEDAEHGQLKYTTTRGGDGKLIIPCKVIP